MRYTRSHKRQHEPNETPRLNATHTHQRGNNSAPLTAQHHPASLPSTNHLQPPSPSTSGQKKRIPKSRSQAFGQAFDRTAKKQRIEGLAEGLAEGSSLNLPAIMTEGLAEGSSFDTFLRNGTHDLPAMLTRVRQQTK